MFTYVSVCLQSSKFPFYSFLVNNPDFKAGVMALANLLQIQRHDDYLVMLKVSFIVLILGRNSLYIFFKLYFKKPAIFYIWIYGCVTKMWDIKQISSVLDYLITTNNKKYLLCACRYA